MSTNPELVNHIIQSMKKQQKQKKQTNLAYIPGVQTPEVKKSDDFNKLKDIGVIHQNFNSIKKMLNSKKFNINDWWFDKKNQKILNKFRKKFVRNSNNLYEDIRRLIN